MPVAAVITPGNARQHAQLFGRKQAIWNRDAQHVRMPLHVQPVLQAQRPELVFAQVAGEETPHLVPVLDYPLIDEVAIDLIVNVHDYAFSKILCVGTGYQTSLPPTSTSMDASAGRNQRSEMRPLNWLPR